MRNTFTDASLPSVLKPESNGERERERDAQKMPHHFRILPLPDSTVIMLGESWQTIVYLVTVISWSLEDSKTAETLVCVPIKQRQQNNYCTLQVVLYSSFDLWTEPGSLSLPVSCLYAKPDKLIASCLILVGALKQWIEHMGCDSSSSFPATISLRMRCS